MADNIVLTGMMGSGKTTVGKVLSEYLPQFSFVDMDNRIELENNCSITEIFNTNGEDYFRKLENETIKQLMENKNQIISLGGGAFEDKNNRNLLLKNSTVIYLKATPYSILRRIQNETHRPLLESGVLSKKITEILKQRETNYTKAHFTVDTNNKTPYNIVEEILGALNE